MGELIVLLLRVVLLKLANRNDPEMIRWREMRDILKANEEDCYAIDASVETGDTRALAAVWSLLHKRARCGNQDR